MAKEIKTAEDLHNSTFMESMNYLATQASEAQQLAVTDGIAFIKMNPDGTMQVLSLFETLEEVTKNGPGPKAA